ncbi:MAG: VWA domain-containing protein, partial [Muribaculaceae bacterium]|nr:VWA domain-containing protein [Muribaculaceae bacterium]
RSGSMTRIAAQAINGVNLTVKNIVDSMADGEGTQTISILPFGTTPDKYLVHSRDPRQVKEFTSRDYMPCGNTALYDTIGMGISDLLAEVEADPENAIGAVTIITDGYENYSKEYTRRHVKELIDRVKGMGWLVAYIGADHDVRGVARELSIDNALEFDKSEAGTRAMFDKVNRSRMSWGKKIMCAEELRDFCNLSAKFFEDEDED